MQRITKGKIKWGQTAANKLGYTKASREGAYSRAKWIKIRDYMLNENPLCSLCKKEGKITSSTIVDHVKAVDGEDDVLFYDLANLQTLCQFHHRQKTRTDNSKYSTENLKRGLALMQELES